MAAQLIDLRPPQPDAAPPPPPPPSRTSWLREPLLHFILAGAVLFAVDHFLVGRAEDPHTIVVGPDVDSEATETFQAVRGRKPNAEELKALHQVWLDNEVLYREGLALQVDKGDTAIRERVIFKALSVIDSNVKLPVADDQILRKWFDGHREKYDEPARYDFEEAALTGDNSEGPVREFVKALNAGTPGDAKAGLRVFTGRPRSNLVQSYGAQFAEELVASKLGEWHALKTPEGWRAMRLNSITPEKPAEFAPLRGVVYHDWTDATSAEQRTAAVRALTKKYKVKYESRPEGSPE